MHRTQIYIPHDIRDKLKEESKKRGISFAYIIRQCLADKFSNLSQSSEKKTAQTKKPKTVDSLLKFSGFSNGGPKDIARNHDLYLYGAK